MTIHHDLAILAAVLLVVACLLGTRCEPASFDKIINMSQSIVIATFAHAGAGMLRAASAKKHEKQEHHEDRSDGQR